MALLNKLFGKKPAPAKASADKPPAKSEGEEKKFEAEVKKPVADSKSNILISSHAAEKATAGQKLNQYVFKIGKKANKISVAKEIKRTYNVKAVKVNIINIPKKARRVGRTKGFKAGYKKAVITLAKGQSIELK